MGTRTFTNLFSCETSQPQKQQQIPLTDTPSKMCSADIFLGLIAILFPPLAVWVKCGICSADSLINICLCMLGFIPGLLHAWYIIAKHPEHDYDSVPNDAESGRVTYIIVDGNRRVAKPTLPDSSYGTSSPPESKWHVEQQCRRGKQWGRSTTDLCRGREGRQQDSNQGLKLKWKGIRRLRGFGAIEIAV